MANVNWSQDVFSKGELSPLMNARVSVQQYYNGLRQAKNTIAYPQGGIGKRFGTLYVAAPTGILGAKYVLFETFKYLGECTYNLVVKPGIISIYLEGRLLVNVSAAAFDTSNIATLDYTTIENRFRLSGLGFRPKDLVRSPSVAATNVISGVASNQLTLTTPVTTGNIFPVRFTTSGTLPTTTPQIKIGITYFALYTSTTTAQLYSNSLDAAKGINAFTITAAGTGTSNLIPQNDWTLVDVAFKNRPTYDFTGGYDAITFTPSAVSGAAVTLTASSAIFTAAHVGGAFLGNGGTARITAFASSTSVTIAVQQPFFDTTAISGLLALLREPAWSDARGWPMKCSSYQNRAFFANSDSLPNGLWGSAINDYGDFNDLDTDDDDAISWYPTSDNVNVIRFIVPYRSLTVHTNSGVYSNSLSFESAITPKTFSLQLQEATPADVVKPRGIDNQIIVITGNDVYSLTWDGLNNAYTSSVVSVTNEHLIRNPVDEAPFLDKTRPGSRYVFIVDEDGSMAIYQTLISESISGFTPAFLEQPYGRAWFRQVASSVDGRCWFLTEREVAVAATPISITDFDQFSLTATGSNFSTTEVTAVLFTTTTSLPESLPQITTTQYYWVKGIDANTFQVFLNIPDALEGADPIEFGNAGVGASVVPYPLQSQWFIEELSFDVFTDCTHTYTGTPATALTGLANMNAQQISIVGDGYGFVENVISNQAVLNAHGMTIEASTIKGGYEVETLMTPMPLSIGVGGNVKSSNLAEPKHVRNVKFMFNDTIGGTVNGVPIALQTLNQIQPGIPPKPASGIFEVAMMEGWNDFKNPSFTIRHTEPFDIRLLGVFYVIEV